MNKKKYIVEKWFRLVDEFETKERAIKNSEDFKGNKKFKDIKIFEVEEIVRKCDEKNE